MLWSIWVFLLYIHKLVNYSLRQVFIMDKFSFGVLFAHILLTLNILLTLHLHWIIALPKWALNFMDFHGILDNICFLYEVSTRKKFHIKIQPITLFFSFDINNVSSLFWCVGGEDNIKSTGKQKPLIMNHWLQIFCNFILNVLLS